MGIFDELKGLGIEASDNIDIFTENWKKNDNVSSITTPDSVKESILYDRKSICPVCEKEIYNRYVKARKVRKIDSDVDLRPIYDKLDLTKYDVILCKYCGFASTTRYYQKFLPIHNNRIKEKITPNFKGRDYEGIYSYETAIERYKLALYNAIVAELPDVNKGYICLKIAWLYRGLAHEAHYNKEIEKEVDAKDKELEFLSMTFEGFMYGISYGGFPFLEINRNMAMLICSDIARKQKDYEKAIELAKRVIKSNNAGHELKDKGKELKEMSIKEKDNQVNIDDFMKKK